MMNNFLTNSFYKSKYNKRNQSHNKNNSNNRNNRNNKRITQNKYTRNEKYIYLKSLTKTSIENKLKFLNNNFKVTNKHENLLLTEKGYYEFNAHKLYKVNKTHKNIVENSYFYMFEKNIEKQQKFQIPFIHKPCLIKYKEFEINPQSFLVIEFLNAEIIDFYIKTTLDLKINDFILLDEISSIEKMLI